MSVFKDIKQVLCKHKWLKLRKIGTTCDIEYFQCKCVKCDKLKKMNVYNRINMVKTNYIWCPMCESDLVNTNSHVKQDDEGIEHYKCVNCSYESSWNFDIAPYPIQVKTDEYHIVNLNTITDKTQKHIVNNNKCLRLSDDYCLDHLVLNIFKATDKIPEGATIVFSGTEKQCKQMKHSLHLSLMTYRQKAVYISSISNNMDILKSEINTIIDNL